MADAAAVWPVVGRMAERAASEGVELLVFPEVTYPSYWLESAERYWRDDVERSNVVLDRISALASKYRLWIVAGYVEEVEEDLYNSAAVFDRTGRLVGSARKQFMWDCDRLWFTPYDASSTFETEWGRMGVLICADLRLPEISATLAARGATFIVQPTAWVNGSTIRRTYRNIQPEFLVHSRATEFGLPFICCSKSGREGDQMEYVGQSRIVAGDGVVVAAAEIGGDELVAAEVAPSTARESGGDSAWRARVLSAAPPHRADASMVQCEVRVRLGAEQILGQLERAGVRTEMIPEEALKQFGPARGMTLEGVQVIVASGRLLDESHPRARAAENRIFVIVADSNTALLVIDPSGRIIWRRVDPSEAVVLDVGQADHKMFTPTTDIWSQRRVGSYQFS